MCAENSSEPGKNDPAALHVSLHSNRFWPQKKILSETPEHSLKAPSLSNKARLQSPQTPAQSPTRGIPSAKHAACRALYSSRVTASAPLSSSSLTEETGHVPAGSPGQHLPPPSLAQWLSARDAFHQRKETHLHWTPSEAASEAA